MAEPDNIKLGRQGELAAARFLKKLGCKILRRNCRSKFGEIDLIVRDGDEVVFVEVKTRASPTWGDPGAAVGARKQQRIRLAAERFASRGRIRDYTLRFDVIAICLPPNAKPQIQHYKDAFSMPGRGC